MVASELFFDLGAYDLTQVAVTPEEVGLVNPQCGHMRQLDHVIWLNEDASKGIGVKEVRDDEFWVPGHIPGRPLFPGVLMIEAAAQLCSVMHHRKTRDEATFIGFARCDNVRFRGQVVPGDTLYLLGNETSFRPKRFVCEAQGVVDGKLVFEATITGMIMPEVTRMPVALEK